MPDFVPPEPQKNPSPNAVHARQVAFFAAFVLPVYKMLELPSILARFTKGGLLFPAILHFLSQIGIITSLLLVSKRSEKSLFERLREHGKGWETAFYAIYAFFFLFVAVLPLLDVEKFVYAAFYDTAPTLFSFGFFFLFAAFFCMKGFKATGRVADFCLFLFLLPFLALTAMSLVEADISNLTPVFQWKFGDTVSAFTYTVPLFFDAVLLLPLIGNMRYRKGDGIKIVSGYSFGAVCTLVFLAVFYGVYSAIAPREHYAFAKIAQYFPALAVVGRIDLAFVYVLSIVLFFFLATPLQYATAFATRATGLKSKLPFAIAVCLGAFLFTLFCNKYYDSIYALFGEKLFFMFALFGNLAPLSFWFLPYKKKYRPTPPTPPAPAGKPPKKEDKNAKNAR